MAKRKKTKGSIITIGPTHTTYKCDDCFEIRPIGERGLHLTPRGYCKGTAPTIGRDNRINQKQSRRRSRSSSTQPGENPKQPYADKTSNSVYPIYIGKNKQ